MLSNLKTFSKADYKGASLLLEKVERESYLIWSAFKALACMTKQILVSNKLPYEQQINFTVKNTNTQTTRSENTFTTRIINANFNEKLSDMYLTRAI